MQYQGKTAVVTGAGSGIGRALTVELCRRGASVAASDVDPAGLERTVMLCRDYAGKACGYDLDVADRSAVLAHADAVAAAYPSIDMVINNAGVAVAATVEEMTFEDLDWLLGINLLGVINGSKAFLPHLIRSGDGHLVNLSSVFGLIAPATQSAYYCAAKFAVRGFTESLRQEMLISGLPVSVHCAHPGGIRTNIARNARVAPSIGSGSSFADDFGRVARTTPERAARVILHGVEAGRPRILIGPDAYLIAATERVIGARYQNLLARLGRRFTP